MKASTTAITLDLQRPNIATMVYAMQNDRASRFLLAQLVDGSTPWTPGTGVLATVRFRKPDGTAGFYDTMEDNKTKAVVISGSTATICLAEQAVTVPGDVFLDINFYDASGSKLTAFTICLRVRPSVLSDAQIISSDYYNVLTATLAQVTQQAQAAEASASSAASSAAAASATLANAVQYLPQTKAADAQNTARQNIGAIGTLRGTAIPAGADLNDYTEPGDYFVSTSTTAAQIANVPETGTGGLLKVLQGNVGIPVHRIQIYLVSGYNSVWLFARRYYDGTWGAWYQFTNSYVTNGSVTGNGVTARWYRNGRNCFVSVSGTLSAAVAANASILTGLPAAMYDAWARTSGNIGLSVGSAGSLRPAADMGQGASVYVSLSYITAT